MDRITLNSLAAEEGTYPIAVYFRDGDDEDIIPTSINWSLITPDGVVVNDRREVTVDSPAADITVVLSGDDLAKTTTFTHEPRMLHIEAVYTSDLGSDLPWHKDILFYIEESPATPTTTTTTTTTSTSTTTTTAAP